MEFCGENRFDPRAFLYYTYDNIIIKKNIQSHEFYLQPQKEKKEKNPWFSKKNEN